MSNLQNSIFKYTSILIISLIVLAGANTCEPCCDGEWEDDDFKCKRLCEPGEFPPRIFEAGTNLNQESISEEDFKFPEEIPSIPKDLSLKEVARKDVCPGLIGGSPRGLACLHCTQPEAEDQSKVIASLLFHSCLKNVAVNYLVDGTFSFDSSLIKEHVDLISSNGRKPFVYFYLSNGATQRQWDRATVSSFGVRMKPEEFREKIKVDKSLQAEFREIVKRLVPIMRYIVYRGGEVSLIPALEDNLDDESFRQLLVLTYEEMPKDISVTLGRNPCPTCYIGNTTWRPDGVFEEVHTSSPEEVVEDGVISNDGIVYSYDSASSPQSNVSLQDLKRVRDKALVKNSAFILWSGERQGLHGYKPGTTVYPAPSERNYSIPEDQEKNQIIKFLRGW